MALDWSRVFRFVMINKQPILQPLMVSLAVIVQEGGVMFGRIMEQYEVVHVVEEHVGQHSSFEMSPQTLDEIQVRTVGRQPKDLDQIGIGFEPGMDGLGVMKAAIVADEPDLSPGVGGCQRNEKGQKIHAAFGSCNRKCDLARHIVHAAIDDLLLVLSWSWHAWLCSNWAPHPRQCWMAMNLHFVLKYQRFRRVLLYGFFLDAPAASWQRRVRLRCASL